MKYFCDCGKPATWLYMPSSDMENPFCCDECVPRGCSCNHRHTNEDYHNMPDLSEDGVENVNWKWIEENKYWTYIDEKGLEWPCCEWDYDENNFEDLDED